MFSIVDIANDHLETLAQFVYLVQPVSNMLIKLFLVVLLINLLTRRPQNGVFM